MEIKTEKKYFTTKNIFDIYDLLKKELHILPGKTPFLWGSLLVGDNDICLYEENDVFEFCIMDHMSKKNVVYFSDVKDAVDYLIEYYGSNNIVADPEKMRSIFYYVLGLEVEIDSTRVR